MTIYWRAPGPSWSGARQHPIGRYGGVEIEGKALSKFGIISPKDWCLKPADSEGLKTWARVGVHAEEWELRARQSTYHWLMRCWQEQEGAFAGHYRAVDRYFEPPQLTNLLAPWQCIAAYDRYGDAELLHKARRAADWLAKNMLETHPMSMVVGGVRDAWDPEEVWTKFTAEYVLLNLGLYARTGEGEYLRRAIQSVRFLQQAESHNHATKYDHEEQQWVSRGWQSFGRIIEAYLYLFEISKENRWLGRALAWGEYSLTLQAPDSAFYLINGEYYNSDIAADEIRALTYLYEQTNLPQFLVAAQGYADWHLRIQRPDGAWLLTIDRFSNPVSEFVGPGDIPNIAISLLRLHGVTNEIRYLEAALRAMKYAMTRQVTPGSAEPFADQEDVIWGFWSWDPYYDHSMSGDQSTHFSRGIWFTLDYLASLDAEQTEFILLKLEEAM